jgi:2-dehydro-3-deoxyphosphooctonate aldolase (KDO 8-P synthase)
MATNTIKINNFEIGGDRLALIAGPCAVESQEMALEIAFCMAEICDKLGLAYIFKGSFDKANRLSHNSGRGIGFERGLEILHTVKIKANVPVLTDVHETIQVEKVAAAVDFLQIPAFLCRQTDLVVEAAKSMLPVNIKKGQFLAPQNMLSIAQKAVSTGNTKIALTERGASFGYGDLILDPRSLTIMKSFGYPVILDATHLCQKPGAGGSTTGGDIAFAETFIKVGLALGVDGIFVEVHPDPKNAISDKDVQIPLANIGNLLTEVLKC